VRRKRVGPYEYHQLVENRWMDGKPRQRVLLHLGRYTSVEAALEGWPKEVEGLRRFASQQWDKADRLKKEERSFERSFERTLETLLERALKAEKLADEIAAKLKNLHDLKDQGKV
jgi:septal ring factor EnvC (AmiA/AmiB activator)